MDPLLTLALTGFGAARDRLARIRENPEAGVSTEYVLVVAAVAIMAIGALAVIATKLMAKTNAINLDATP
jgi:hypothetical protein